MDSLQWIIGENMKRNLLKLGFTPNEASVYLALLDLGETPTGAIIKKTGLHRNIVYEALDELVRRRLAGVAIQKGKKHYRALDPRALIEDARETLDTATATVQSIRRKVKTVAPIVTVYEGSDGWQTAYRRVVKTLRRGDCVYTLGAGADKWVEAMGGYFIGYEKFCREYDITIRMIAYEWQRGEIEAHQSQLIREVRYLTEKHAVPANTEIFPDRVFLQIYSDPVVLIEIVNKEVAQGYLQHFLSLWRVAKR